MKNLGYIGKLGTVGATTLALAALLMPAALAATTPTQQTAGHISAQTPSHSGQPVVLDRVIAIVNGEVLLQSDVDQEKRLAVLSPLHVSASSNTDVAAAHRLIRRTLMLEQMQQQGQPTTVSKTEAEKGLQQLRATLHGCAPESCSSQQAWTKFLHKHGITEQEAIERWSQRMAIENFINLRFRAGIHITPKQISTYYNHTLVPALEDNSIPVPPLKEVSSRIQQLLLAEHVNAMISQWLKSLRQEGSVQILVPAYGKSTQINPDNSE